MLVRYNSPVLPIAVTAKLGVCMPDVIEEIFQLSMILSVTPPNEAWLQFRFANA
jgi:hypothetical protein